MNRRSAATINYYRPKLTKALTSRQAGRIGPVLTAVTVAAWLAGIRAAAAGPGGNAIGAAVTSSGLDLGVADDVAAGFAEDFVVPPDAPSALRTLLDAVDGYASALATDDSPLSTESQADMITSTEAASAAEAGAQAAMAVGGIDQWKLQNDSDDPCDDCLAAHDGGPYPVGDGPDLGIHPRCQCESVAVVPADDNAARSVHDEYFAMLRRGAVLDAGPVGLLHDLDTMPTLNRYRS